MLETPSFWVFVWLAIAETFNPGPSLLYVIDSRTKGDRHRAMNVVIGITAANILWVVLALGLVYYNVGVVRTVGDFVVLYCAAPVLLFLAAERLLESLVAIIAGQPKQSTSSVPTEYSLLSGFLLHFLNPLSPIFYLGGFVAILSGLPLRTGLGFAVVPVVVDLVIFGLIVNFDTILAFFAKKLSVEVGQPPARFVAWASLVSGVLLFILSANVSQRDGAVAGYHRGVEAVLLLAVLAATLRVATKSVASIADQNARVIWRAVSLWDSWFKLIAVLGAVSSFAVLQGGTAKVPQQVQMAFTLAAVLAAGLSYTKSIGELQDERGAAGRPSADVRLDCWQLKGPNVGAAVLSILVCLLALIYVTSYKLPDRPPDAGGAPIMTVFR